MSRRPKGAVVVGIVVAYGIGHSLAPQPALAFGGFDSAGIIAAITTLQSAAEEAIGNLGQSMVDNFTHLGTSLTSGFTQLSNYMKASVGADEQIADATNQVNARLARDVRNAQVRDDHTVNAEDCKNLAGGQAAVVAVHEARDVAVALNDAKDLRAGAARGTPSWAGSGQATLAANRLHFTRYCNDAEQEAGLCSAPGDAALSGADEKASSLLGKAVYGSQTDIDAANDYATSLIQPVAPPAMRGSVLQSNAGQAALPARRGYTAAISLANTVASDVLSWRAGVVPLTPAQQAEAAAEHVPASGIGSAFQAMDLEINRRYSGVSWQSALQAMQPKSVQVQIALLLAQQNYIAWQSFQLQQKQALAEAAILSNLAAARLQPQPAMPNPSP